MPVDIPFVKKTLEQCMGHSVEIQQLFDFLDDIVDSPSPKRSLTEFVEKWRSCLHKSSQKMIIVRYKGTWSPLCLTKSQLDKQAMWSDFARTYDDSYVQCTVDSETSPEFQPLNFQELLRLTFWKEMYEKFGKQIVAHIFDKCALLYEMDEGLYLIVGYPNGSFYKKMWKYERNTAMKSASSCTTQLNRKHKHRNPYQLRDDTEKCNDVGVVVEKENSDDFLMNIREPEVIVLQSTGAVKRARPISHENPEQQPKTKRVKVGANPPSISVNHWILPKPEVLRKLIHLRESQCNSYNIPHSTQSTTSHILNFVWVLNDQAFKPIDKLFVMKQTAVFSVNKPKLPKDWVGLKLPNNLPSLANSEGRIHICVYNISETLARKMNIRIKPKGRQRKKKIQTEVDVQPAPNIHVESISSTLNVQEKQPPRKACKSKPEKGNTLSPFSERKHSNLQNIKNTTSASHRTPSTTTSTGNGIAEEQRHGITATQPIPPPTIQPYSLSFTLPISSCLYNKSSWSKWPVSHCVTRAVNLLNELGDGSAIRFVADDILKVPVCSESAYQKLEKSYQKWITTDHLNPLNKIVIDIVKAHSKFKDVHKLFKNCVSHWRMKYFKKQERKCKSANSAIRYPVGRGRWKTLTCKSSAIVEQPEVVDLAKDDNSAEVIDLAEDDEPVQVIDLSLTPMSTIQCPYVDQLTIAVPPISHLPSSSSANVGAEMNTLTEKLSQRTQYDLLRKSSAETVKKKSFASLKHPIPHNSVMQTLKHIFYLMKLDEILGSRRNKRGFFKFVRKALILGGTKSSLHLSELMAMIHPGDIPIVHVTTCQLAIETFTAKLVTWLFNNYVLLLLKTCCYVTECSHTRMQVMFYLRESWTSASYKMKTQLTRKGALNERTGTGSQLIPNATLRYVPKINHSLRSLLDIRKEGLPAGEDAKKINMYLHYLDAKINKSRMYLPTTLQREWRKFYGEWKARGSQKLYYLRMDIRDAYPSVSLQKLNAILSNSGLGTQSQNQMLLKQYALYGNSGIKRIRESIFEESNRDNWHSGIHVRPCIAMDLGNDVKINVWEMLKRFKTILNTINVVKIGKKSYNFHYGLPQGWGQSPILCNIYYGYIDSLLYLPYLESKGRLFLRIVDDYLFVTPKANEVSNLIQLMKIGCDQNGIKLNDDKSVTNIYVRSDEAVPSSDCELVTFCGWNFCMTCGHVSRDFKKYIGQDFCSTITFNMPMSINSPEQFLRLRGTVIVPARVKPILLDPAINCYKRILLTVFEASVILGFRFYAICRVVYPNLNALKEEERVNVIIFCIRLCCTRLARYAARNAEYHGPTFSSQEKVSCGANCCGNENTLHAYPAQDFLCVDSLKYTALYGFRVKLRNHSAVFDRVLPLLDFMISSIRNKLGVRHCDSILEVVGSKMPKCFSEILV